VDEALETYRKSRAIREPLAADFPTDTDAVRDAAIAHEKIGDAMAAKGELREALESRRKSLEIFQKLVDADPQNVQARQSLAISYLHLGEILGDPASPNLGRQAEALQQYRRALETLEAANAPEMRNNAKVREILQRIQGRMAALRSR
jgi:tetratricopeptide (TPR) repeat protein